MSGLTFACFPCNVLNALQHGYRWGKSAIVGGHVPERSFVPGSRVRKNGQEDGKVEGGLRLEVDRSTAQLTDLILTIRCV